MLATSQNDGDGYRVSCVSKCDTCTAIQRQSRFHRPHFTGGDILAVLQSSLRSWLVAPDFDGLGGGSSDGVSRHESPALSPGLEAFGDPSETKLNNTV